MSWTRKTLSTDEIDKLVANTIETMEAIKGTPVRPYIKMDLSAYTRDTLESIKEAFAEAGVRFECRWPDGSDFMVPVDVECAPPAFRSGRRDVVWKEGDPIIQKLPQNLGRRDVFTKSIDSPFYHQSEERKPPLSERIQSAANRAAAANTAADFPEKKAVPER